MSNLDMKKTLKEFYKPSAKTVSIVDVPPLNYIMIDGEGNPGTAEMYQQAVTALYNLAYTIRAISKAAGITFTVMPLEGLWWFKGKPIENFVITDADKDRFVWTMMIAQPEHVTAAMVEQAREQIQAKKAPALLDNIRFERYHEGETTQILHIGPYADEAPNIKRLHETIEQNGWQLAKKHHEIYLSDPRRVTPEKLKTVIRQPFNR